MTLVFEGLVLVGCMLVDDEYPSYSGVANNLGIPHNVVTHPISSVAPDGMFNIIYKVFDCI